MSGLLEIFGRAITADTADLIWHWLDTVRACEGPTSQAQQLNKIIELTGNMKVETAQELLESYLFENPSCVYGQLTAAAIWLHKNQLHNAIEQLDAVYTRQPSNTLALYALGHCYERLGKESQAIEFYQDCLKFKNFLQFPRQRLAAIYFKNGQLEKTIQEYELLRDEYLDDVSTLITLGNLYIANERYADAIEMFNTAILIHPDNFNTEDNDIEQLIQNGQLHEALEQLESLSQLQLERADLIAKQGDILSMLGSAEEAASRYEEAIDICPDFLEATIKLGTEYLRLQQERPAAKQFNRAVEINDQIVDAYIGLATAHKLADSFSEALATLSLASAIQPNSSLLFAETATLQFKTSFGEDLSSHNPNGSAEVIEAVIGAHRRQITLRPHNPDLHYRFGILMMSVGRTSTAISSFRSALEINPTYNRARSKLAVCLFEADQKQTALEQLAGPECLDKNTLKLHYKTALLYCNKIKFASSLINLDRLLEDNFTCADPTTNISIVLQNLGLLDRAAAMWDNLSDTAHQAMTTNYLFPPEQEL